MSMVIPTIRFIKGAAEIIDQTLLPAQYAVRRLYSVDSVCEAIKSLRVRGAPALGVAAAYGLLVAVEETWKNETSHYFDDGRDGCAGLDHFPADVSIGDVLTALDQAREQIAATRPTAVNLHWALDRMAVVYKRKYDGPVHMLRALRDEAVAIYNEDLDMCRSLGRHGSHLIEDGAAVMTHCNAGGLATSGFGTALGVIFAAAEAGKSVRVYADETRPLLQGSRLTAWECRKRNVPVTVLAEGAAASLLGNGDVSCVVVGADRIAANGDTANKVGTCGVAVLANRFGVPFYVAAPTSTIDYSLSSGTEIPIEQRPADEILTFAGVWVAPRDADAYNPAFDVTPAELITAIITEKGIFEPPYVFEPPGG